MATTTNFGWETPDDTDLVKDGALAMRTLGNSIDASFVDLKGGTTGQVLAKASNSDLDFTWATDASGIPATIFDAKGDIIAASAADTAARLAVGANGTVLTADSAESTGLKWATPSSTFAGCALRNSANISISDNVETKFTFNTEIFDVGDYHSTSSNTSRITIPSGKAGKYLFTLLGNFGTNASGVRELTLYKNGASYFAQTRSNTPGLAGLTLSMIADAAVGDYFELNMYQTSGTSLSCNAIFTATYLGA
jgi:hypothetical protein